MTSRSAGLRWSPVQAFEIIVPVARAGPRTYNGAYPMSELKEDVVVLVLRVVRNRGRRVARVDGVDSVAAGVAEPPPPNET